MSDITLYYNSTTPTNLLDFLHDKLVDTSLFSVENALNYPPNTTNTNRQAIWNALTPEQRSKNAHANSPSDITGDFMVGVVGIKVPIQFVSREIVSTATNIISRNIDFNAFLGNEITKIINSVGFKPLNEPNANGFNVYRQNGKCSVIAYSKALDNLTNARLLNLTPFIMSLQTNVSENGGNFSFSLVYENAVPPKLNNLTSKDVWKISDISNTGNSGEFQFISRNALLNSVPQNENPTSTYTIPQKQSNDNRFRTHSFFKLALQHNDIVFIKFERLAMEKNSDDLTPQGVLSESDLPNQVYDMIGLIDTVNESYNSQTNTVQINVTGRDCMKLLIDDGCYFFPNTLFENPQGFFNEQTNLGRAVQRLISNGNLNSIAAMLDRTIEFTVAFVLNNLSNIQICPDNLFNAYGEKRTKRYGSDAVNNEQLPLVLLDANRKEPVQIPLENKNNDLQEVNASGIWQIIKAVFDDSISTRRIVENGLVNNSGSLLNYIRAVVQEPFAEFWGDTYGDQYYFICRKPPFNKQAYKSLPIIEIDYSMIDSENLFFDDMSAISWYQLLPRGNFIGDHNVYWLKNFPAIFLPEYAEIWGSKPLQIVSNYIDYKGQVQATKSNQNTDYLREQAINDLQYVIDCTAYLPFTERGTIKLCVADRRIKRGMCIIHKGQGKRFYVEGVSQHISFTDRGTERYTILEVSRGMVEKHIDKYFEIVTIKDFTEMETVTSVPSEAKEHIIHFERNLTTLASNQSSEAADLKSAISNAVMSLQSDSSVIIDITGYGVPNSIGIGRGLYIAKQISKAYNEATGLDVGNRIRISSKVFRIANAKNAEQIRENNVVTINIPSGRTNIIKKEKQMNWKVNKDIFNFFLKRLQFV